MRKSVLVVILAEGFEEIEAFTPIDILRRAGIEVVIAGLEGGNITGAHGVKVACDLEISDMDFDMIDGVVLPGGLPGAENLAASYVVLDAIKVLNGKGKLVAAICASPAYVLENTGILVERSATCYPGCESRFSPEVKFLVQDVVVDGNIITSRGPATAFPFALALVEYLAGKEKRDELAKGMLWTK